MTGNTDKSLFRARPFTPGFLNLSAIDTGTGSFIVGGGVLSGALQDV